MSAARPEDLMTDDDRGLDRLLRPASVEPLRRVDQGAKPIEGWNGPRWAPNGLGKYDEDIKGHWWPTEEARTAGYQPCKACSRTRRTPLVSNAASA
jgi:hypothetical protein